MKPKPTEEAKQRAKNYMSLKGALEPKQETLEEAAEIMYGTDMDSIRGGSVYDLNTDLKRGFIEGVKSDAARHYWFEQFKKK